MGAESRMMIVLSEEERVALRELSQRELRGMREQARYLLREELARRGLMVDKQSNTAAREVACNG